MSGDVHAALITGGASGIGYATAERLGADGAVAILADRDGEAATDAAARLRADGASAHAIALDVSDPTSVARGIDAAVATHGGLDLLVNCAGFARPVPSAEIDEESWAAQLDVPPRRHDAPAVARRTRRSRDRDARQSSTSPPSSATSATRCGSPTEPPRPASAG